ncbi:restriction endonuclease subunit S [Rossellomorea marisflavi]|uniref:restriction endonuclease subunit S n=1 Tax=Rossellomorea marisflavi TaxID=189381 RepID=UPI0039BF5EC0
MNEINNIPPNWNEKKIEDICDILDYMRIPLNAQEREKIKGNIPYYGANGVQGYINKFLFNEDLILIAEDGGNFEQYATRPIAYKISGKSWVNNHAHILKVKEGYDINFVFYSLVHKNILPFIKGGTRSKLNQSELREITIIVPNSIDEQFTIGQLLSKLDKGLELTHELIDKNNRIKQGMMHDLLTKGIDEKGNIRSEATHTFKDSPLGRIPVEWDVDKVENHLESIDQGWSPQCEFEAANTGEWGVLKTTAVTWDGYNPFENKRLPSHLTPRPQYEVKQGDILMTRGGPNSRVGVVSFVQDTREKLMLSDKLYRLIPKKHMRAKYLALALSTDATQRHLSTMKTGMAESQTNISQEIVKNLNIKIISLPEQDRIIQLLQLHEDNIEKLNMQFNKLKKIKTGLMQDLLSGRVLVTDIILEDVAM